MKKLFALWLLAFIVAVYFGAGGVDAQSRGDGIRDYHKYIDSVTVDSAIGGNWEPIDSLVATRDDSGIIVISVEGIAHIDPLFEGLYISIGNDSANRVDSATSATTGQTHSNFDTVLIEIPGDIKNTMKVPFHFTWLDTASTASAKTDTYYVNCATKATSTRVFLDRVFIRADPIEKDSI